MKYEKIEDWSEVEWSEEVKARVEWSQEVEARQEWSQVKNEVKKSRWIEELKNWRSQEMNEELKKPRNEWRIEEAKNEELKKWRMNEEWMKN